VAEKVHLQNRIVHRHGFEGEALRADDIIGFRLADIRDKAGLYRIHTALEGALAEPLFEAGFVFAHLALHGGNRGVYGRKHIGCLLICAENQAARMHRQFNVIVFPFHAEGDKSFGFRLEIAV
jgi:hypothetical protein